VRVEPLAYIALGGMVMLRRFQSRAWEGRQVV
jgi:hypothetical protein